MKKLSKIKLQNAVVLENQEMKMIFGGSGVGGYDCWCNNTYIGSGSSHLDCAAKCFAWCEKNPC